MLLRYSGFLGCNSIARLNAAIASATFPRRAKWRPVSLKTDASLGKSWASSRYIQRASSPRFWRSRNRAWANRAPRCFGFRRIASKYAFSA